MGSINHLSKYIRNAAILTDQLRPLLREVNEKKKMKSVKLPMTQFDGGWEGGGGQHSLKTGISCRPDPDKGSTKNCRNYFEKCGYERR